MNDDRQSQNPVKKPAPARQKTAAELREARLKAALKANMAKRKSQAKARNGQNTE